jgi:hypothetical protein
MASGVAGPQLARRCRLAEGVLATTMSSTGPYAPDSAGPCVPCETGEDC